MTYSTVECLQIRISSILYASTYSSNVAKAAMSIHCYLLAWTGVMLK